MSGELVVVVALTMIKVRPGYEKSAYSDLQKRTEVKDIYRLFGEFSFFLIMQTEGKSKLEQIMKDIKKEDMVVKTSPVMVAMGSDLTETAFTGVAERAYS